MQAGPRNLITDVPGILVGNAEDRDLVSGTTVLTAAQPLLASVHTAGGAPGTRETDLLAPEKWNRGVDALVLSGGSAFGLDAASGVMAGLAERGRGVEVRGHRIPIVPAAILFDLREGAPTPTGAAYARLGRAALGAAGTDFALGSTGAGTGATTARHKGGLGSASALLPGGGTVGALVAANPVGEVLRAGGPEFWAAPFEIGAEFGGFGLGPDRPLAEVPTKLTPGTATTIAIVATDLALDKAQLHRLAIAAHDGIARAVVPAHTPFDGDLVFACTTGSRPFAGDPAEVMALTHAAATTLARAIARAVYCAAARPGDIRPSWASRFASGAPPTA